MSNKFLYTQKMMSEDLKSIYNAISHENFVPDYIVGMARGGLVPATCLSHTMQIPMMTLEWSKSRQRVNQNLCELISNQKANIMIVDDIVDTGDLLKELFQDWERWCDFDESFIDCSAIRVASLVNYKVNDVLYENLSGSIMCNYYGRSMSERPWVDFWWEVMDVN